MAPASSALTTRPTAALARANNLLAALLQLVPSAGLVGKVIKYLALLLLAVNARSFPGTWHIRLWAHVWWWQLKRRLYGNDARYFELMCPIGQSPFQALHVMQGLATLDDCDMFGHLSNSSYAKTLDIARFQTLMKYTVPFYGEKGNTALGGSDYAFFREIPIMASYEMRTTIGAWDHKWIYLVTYFVSYPQKGSKLHKQHKSQHPHPLVPPAPLPKELMPPNAVLHCVAVSRYCFKNKRLTVPPTVALSLSGFGGTSELGWARWYRTEHLRNTGGMRAVLSGGWKEEVERPAEEGGFGLEEFEAERLRGMHVLGQLLRGMESLRAAPEKEGVEAPGQDGNGNGNGHAQ